MISLYKFKVNKDCLKENVKYIKQLLLLFVVVEDTGYKVFHE